MIPSVAERECDRNMISETSAAAIAGEIRTADTPAKPRVAGRGTVGALYGLRIRALLVGVPLVVGISMLTVYAALTKSLPIGSFQIVPQAVMLLFVLALVNRLAMKLRGAEVFTPGDLLVIYTMLIVAVLVSSTGAIAKLIPSLTFLPYYSTNGNHLSQLVASHLPAWAMPFSPAFVAGNPPAAIAHYYESLPDGASIPWSVWIGPLCAWFALIGMVFFVFGCMATLLRRQWVDHEQLRFPLTLLPLAIIENKIDNEPFWTNRKMWLGFAFAAAFWALNGWSSNNPDVPRISTLLWFDQLFTERPWNAIGYFWFTYSLSLIALAYFLPTDLLFSVWFFYLINRYQEVAFMQSGAIPASMEMNDVKAWGGFQAAGAFFALVAMQLRVGLPYFRQVWKTAWCKDAAARPLDDRDEMMSYRTALLGMLAGFAGIVLWLSLAGMNPLVAAAQMGIYIFVIALVLTRAVNEGGWLQAEAGFMPYHLISLVVPMQGLGVVNNAMLGLTNGVFTRDVRGLLLSPIMDAQKMASATRTRNRALGFPLLLAVVLSFCTAAAVLLYIGYTQGALGYSKWSSAMTGELFTRSAANMDGTGWKADGTAYTALVVGIVATVAMTFARSQLPWFPLHPLGYAISFGRGAFVLWFSFFVAWLLKALTMKYSGADTYRRTIPFAIGVILGEFTMQVFWMIMATAFGWKSPTFLS